MSSLQLTNLPKNVQRLITEHLSEKNKRMLALALRDPQSAKVIQHAWRQFVQSQKVGSMHTLPPIHRRNIQITNAALLSRQLGLPVVNRQLIARTANAWKSLATLPREQRRLTGLGNVYKWRGPHPPNAVQVSYSTSGRSISGVPPFVKNLHMKTNKQFKNYVTNRFRTYKNAANNFGQIDRYLKKAFPNYNRNGKSLVKLLYPKLNRSWWVKVNNE
jgi:hypothetical protein